MDSYLNSQDLNSDQCWRSKYEVFPTSDEFDQIIKCALSQSKQEKEKGKRALSKLVASFMEMLLRNVNTLETLVVGLNCIRCDDAKWLEETVQMPSNENNVSIVFKLLI